METKKITKKEQRKANKQLFAKMKKSSIDDVTLNKAIDSYGARSIYSTYRRYKLLVRVDIEVDWDYYPKRVKYPKTWVDNRRVCFYQDNLCVYKHQVESFRRGYMDEAIKA